MSVKLSRKQIKFCNEYLIDLNATQAAIRAGYSKKTANEIGCQNLAKLYISEYIQDLQQKLQEKTEITAEKVIAELAKIGFANVQDFVNGGNAVLELKHLGRDKVAAVSGIETTVNKNGDTTTKVRFHDKVSALEKLGKHLGIFEKDNLQKVPESVDSKILESIAAKINS